MFTSCLGVCITMATQALNMLKMYDVAYVPLFHDYIATHVGETEVTLFYLSI